MKVLKTVIFLLDCYIILLMEWFFPDIVEKKKTGEAKKAESSQKTKAEV